MSEESTPPVPVTESRILFYQSEDGTSRIEVRLEEGTVWLPQALIARAVPDDQAECQPPHPERLRRWRVAA